MKHPILPKKVLAIINIPQECGEPTIDFISLETGKVIDFVSLEGFNGSMCITFKNEFIGDNIIVYNNGYIGKINDPERYIETPLYHDCYIDEDCTQKIELPKPIHRRVQNDDTYYIRSIEFVKRIDDPDYINSDQDTKDFMAKYIHKYTICHMKKDIPVYNQENDDFYWSFKKKFNIELPFFKRQSMDFEKDLLPMCAKLLNFEVINVLH